MTDEISFDVWLSLFRNPHHHVTECRVPASAPVFCLSLASCLPDRLATDPDTTSADQTGQGNRCEPLVQFFEALGC